MEERRRDNQLNSERLIRVELALVDHQRHSDENFTRLIKQMGENREEISQNIESLRLTVQKLWDIKNRQDGALNASRYIGHVVTAAISGAIAFVISYLKTGGKLHD